MQDVADAATEVLGNRVNNSGTFDRGILAAALANPVGAMSAATYGAPALIPYVPGMQRLVAALMASRPQAVYQSGGLFPTAAGQLAPTGYSLATPQRQPRR